MKPKLIAKYDGHAFAKVTKPNDESDYPTVKRLLARMYLQPGIDVELITLEAEQGTQS